MHTSRANFTRRLSPRSLSHDSAGASRSRIVCNAPASQPCAPRSAPTMRLASGCVRCDPVSLVTLMQPEIYCRWLCADGSTRCRRRKRRRRRERRRGWRSGEEGEEDEVVPRPRLSNGRYRLTWPRRPRCILLSMPNTVLYLLVEERISTSGRHFCVHRL